MTAEKAARLPEDYRAASDCLHNRVMLVTGAGSGIGRAISLALARHGATVVLLGRTMAALEAVYDEIEAEGLAQPAIYPMNLEGATEKDYRDMCDALDAEFGRLDGILHNASDLGDRTAVRDYTSATWQRVMKVNATAPFMLTQALLPLLERADDASVLFTSSGVAPRGRAFWGAYAASKAASDNLMQTLADEFDGTRLRFNSVNPGATRTAMRTRAYPAEDPNTVKPPEALIPLYLYLLGPDSRGINGQWFTAEES